MGPKADRSRGRTQDRRGAAAPRRPLYQEVKRHVLERIQEGVWAAHHRLPSENELVGLLGVSRMTVHRALRELSAEGCLYRLQGSGTFVAPPQPLAGFLEVRSIAEEIGRRGGRHRREVLRLEELPAPPEVAAALQLAPGAPVFHAVLRHTDRDVPIQVAERFVNPAVAPEFLQQDFTAQSPSEYLFRVAPATEAEHVVEAVIPPAAIRRLLQMPKGEPCLVLHRTTWVGSVAATRSRFVHPASRFRMGSRFRITPEEARRIG